MGDISWFQRGRFGVLWHFGVYSAAGIPPSWPLAEGLLTYDQYEALAWDFKPAGFDPAEWAALAKEAGACYAILTAKHHDGFAMWNTATTDFCAPKTAAGRDLVMVWVEAMRSAGLKVGLYFSLPDWHTPDYPVDSDLSIPGFMPARPPLAWPPNPYHKISDDPARWQRFLNFMRTQLEELLHSGGYGPIDLLWFDGGWEHTVEEWNGYEVVRQIRGWQPNIILNDRIHPGMFGVRTTVDPGLSDYIECEMLLPAPLTTDPWERALTMSDQWSFVPSDDTFKSTGELIRMLAETASGGGTLLLDMGPNGKGLLPGNCASRLLTIGDWMRGNGDAIRGTGKAILGLLPIPVAPSHCGVATLNRDSGWLYLHIFSAPPNNQVEVPNVKLPVLEVKLLASGRALQWFQPMSPDPLGYYGNRLLIDLPREWQDPYDTVVAVRLAMQLQE